MPLYLQAAIIIFLSGQLSGCKSDKANSIEEPFVEDMHVPGEDSFSTKQAGIEEFAENWTYQIWKGKRGKDVPQQFEWKPERIEDLTRPDLRIPKAPKPHPVVLPAPPLLPRDVIVDGAISSRARNEALIASATGQTVQSNPLDVRANLGRPAAPSAFPAFGNFNSPEQEFVLDPPRPKGWLPASQKRSVGLQYLASLSGSELKSYDIAFLNLMCLENMHGFKREQIDGALKKLDRWAIHVAYETERNFYKFRQRPDDFRAMEGYFRMLVLVSVIQQDFGARYNPDRDSTLEKPQSDDEFFSDPRDVFIHGFTDRSAPMGTCSSFPVLYTAIAQRLRYPVFLVTAKEHLFCRWDDGIDQFNIEATSSGLNVYPDEYYFSWPRTMTRKDLVENNHLKSLSASESFAVFLSIRGACLLHSENDPKQALEAFRLASSISPSVKNYKHAETLLTQ